MTITKHTPGPWYIPYPRLTPGSTVAIRSRAYADDEKDFLTLADVRAGLTREEGDANARLIAAAPDMLAALQLAMEDGFLAGEALEAVEAAIAKATQS